MDIIDLSVKVILTGLWIALVVLTAAVVVYLVVT